MPPTNARSDLQTPSASLEPRPEPFTEAPGLQSLGSFFVGFFLPAKVGMPPWWKQFGQPISAA